MKKMMITSVLLMLCMTIMAQTNALPRTIEVSAKATRSIQPQSADINITVYNSSLDGARIVEVAETEKELRAGFKKLGMKEEDFFAATPGSTSNPESMNFTIRMRNLDLWPKVSALFDYDLIENIYVVRSDFSDAQKAGLEKELIKEGLALAKKKADDLAALINAKIKRIYTVRVYSPYITPPSGSSGGENNGNLNFGSSTMELEVYVTYEIE